jgi:hypothetical protein
MLDIYIYMWLELGYAPNKGHYGYDCHDKLPVALQLTQPVREMGIKNIPGGKGFPACNADNLTAMNKLSV